MNPAAILTLALALPGQYAAGYGHANYQAAAVYTQWVPVGDPTPYYGGLVSAAYRYQQAQQASDRAVGDLTAQVQALADQVAALTRAVGGGAPQPTPQPTPQPSPDPPPPPTPQPPAPAPAPVPVDDAPPPEVVAVFAKFGCAKCHTGKAAKAGITLYGDDGKPVPLGPLTLQAVSTTLKIGRMPPSGPVPDDDYQTVAAYEVSRGDEIVEALVKVIKGGAK
jgi:hypothetical protein